MSYSFSVVAPSKSEAVTLVAVELDRVVVAQPVHAADRAAAQATADALIGLLREEPDMDVRVSCWGSIIAPTTGIREVRIGADVSLAPREALATS